MFPVVPHLVSECLATLGENKEIKWPEVNKKSLNEETNKIVVQVNGKKKEIIFVNHVVNEKEILELIKKNEKIQKILNNAKIKKTIYVKNRLINLII